MKGWTNDSGITWPPSPQNDHSRLAHELKKRIPGLGNTVEFPCMCGEIRNPMPIWSIIQHLNDDHHPVQGHYPDDRWSRERIAQWTEELPFDLTIQPEDARDRRSDGLTAAQQAALIKAINDSTKEMQAAWEAANKAIQPIVESFAKMTKTFEVTFTNVDPKMYEMLTGLPCPDDKEEEA